MAEKLERYFVIRCWDGLAQTIEVEFGPHEQDRAHRHAAMLNETIEKMKKDKVPGADHVSYGVIFGRFEAPENR